MMVVLWETPHPECAARLERAGFATCAPDDPQARHAQALVSVTQRVDRAVLERFPQLRLVAVAFTGYDAVDLEACRARQVRVANVPEYATGASAELALGLCLAWMRGLPRADRELHALRWDPRVGRELSGQCVGLVGTGRIAMRLAELLQPFRVRLVGWSRSRNPVFEKWGGEYLPDPLAVARVSDVVSLHLPLTPQTRGLWGRRELEAMPAHALLINVARGALVDMSALHECLSTRKLAGAVLDVYPEEPFQGTPPLHELDSVVLSPHLGFRTHEALERRLQVCVENIRAFFAGAAQNLVA